MSDSTNNEMVSNDIVRSLVKVKLTVCHWIGRYTSKALSREIEFQKSTGQGSVSADVIYLTELYSKPITVAMSRLRRYWNDNTLPWDDNSWRVVSAASYQTLMDNIVAYKHEFDAAVDDIINNYDAVKEAAVIKLGGLYDASVMPGRDDLRRRYGVYIYSDSINTADDVRIDGLSDSVIDKIRDNVRDQHVAQIKGAMHSIIERVQAVASDVVERMKKPAGDTKYGTLLRKIEKTCSSLSGLNLTRDPKVDALLSQLRTIVSADTDADMLKVNQKARDETKQRAEGLLSALDKYCG